MRPVVVSVTGVGNSPVIPMDFRAQNFNVGIGVVVSGTVTYTVQHTFDDVYNTAVTPTWFNNATLASLSANADGNYAFPVRAVRLNVSAGTGTATMTLIETAGQG